MSVIVSSRRAGGGRSSPRVGIAQGADLGTVVTYLVERAGDEVRGRVRGTRRGDNAQAASRQIRALPRNTDSRFPACRTSTGGHVSQIS